MKKFIIVGLFACLGCFKEEKIDPSTASTFVKYFNGGFNDFAEDIKQTSDGGYIMLATSEVRPNEVTPARFKIKLTKVDEFGALQWQKLYPEFDNVNNTDSVSYKGRAISLVVDGAGIETGYVVVGDSIQKGLTNKSHLRIMLTDTEGNMTRAKSIDPSGGVRVLVSNQLVGIPVEGKAVAISSTGSFIVLSQANPLISDRMYLSEFSANLDSMWSRSYEAGATSLSNRLFIDAAASLFWSGTVTKSSNRSDIRLTKAPPNSQNTEFDLDIGTPGNKETGMDMCEYGFGFAVIGTTDETAAKDEDLLFKRIGQDGAVLASQQFGFPGQAENGLAISQARDGGLVLLGSVDSNTEVGRGGKDYYLIKINAFGDTEWTRIFGSKSDDIGKKVISLSDGSYTIFGTTIWGGLRTMTLIKTDSQGQIE
ncbi:MAG: hypothetical protein RIB47_02360 [Cyclobacteriaceae bacterium]